MTGLERGEREEERLERGTGIGLGQRGAGVGEQRFVHGFEHRFDERLFGGEVAAHGADPDSGAPGHFFDLRLQAHLGEHGLGRGQHPLPVAPRVAAHRPVGGAGVRVRVRGHGGSRRNGMVLPILANRNGDSI